MLQPINVRQHLAFMEAGDSGLVRQLERRRAVSYRLRMFLARERKVTDLSGAAEALNMSPRSLRRHLQAEGVTFQKILDEFRKELADKYLVAGAMSPKEVANLTGFANVDSFRRAYKAWGKHVGVQALG